MMKAKRLLAIILSAMMTMGIAAGCGGKTEQSSDPGAGNGSASGSGSDAGALPETADLKVFMPIFNETHPEDTVVGQKWLEMMESYTGAKLNISWEEIPFADYTQKISVYLASGDWADVFTYTGSTPEQLMELGQTGMLLCLDDYADYTPNLNKYLNDEGLRKYAESADGKLYGFPQLVVSPYEGGSQCCFAIRLDAFEQYDIPIPTTLDEVYEAAKKIKGIYPNSYPISSNGANLLYQMYGIYNTGNGIYWNGENYAYGPTDGKLKSMVEYLAKLYAEGLLDPEYATQTNEMQAEKALNDITFINPFIYALRLTDQINAASDTVEWAEIALPVGPNGDTPWINTPLHEGYSVDKNYSVVINAQTKYPELLMKLADYQLSDEMIELATWGVEGETFNYTEDGGHTFTDVIANAENVQTKMAEFGLYGSMACRPGIAFMPDSKENYFEVFPKMPSYLNGQRQDINSWEFYTQVHESKVNISLAKEPSLPFSEEDVQLRVDNMTPVNTFVDENIAKFIANERPMSEWDVFIEELSDYGDYQAVLDMYNARLAEFNGQ